MRFLSYVALQIAFVSSLAFAQTPDDCRPVRLDQPPGSMSRLPVPNQGGRGICFAVSAAQMVDAWRFSHGDTNYSHMTSAAAAAVFSTSEANDEWRYDIDGGDPQSVVESIRRNGSCNDQTIARGSTTDILEYFARLKVEFNGLRRGSLFLTNPDALNRTELREAAERVQCTLRAGNTGASVPTLSQITDALVSRNPVTYYNGLLRPMCERNSIPIPNLGTVKYSNSIGLSPEARIAKYRDAIGRQFGAANPQPMTLAYCRDVYRNASSRGVADDGRTFSPGCQMRHGAVVVGQRRNTAGKCELLIRESSGANCDHFQDVPGCDGGQIWIDADNVLRNTLQITWLE